MKIALAYDAAALGGGPDDSDVFDQIECVEAALCALGHETVRVAFDVDLARTAERLRAAAADLVFNLVESVGGHGRLIHLAPAWFEALGLAYTGVRTEPMLVTSDKVLTKQRLIESGEATPAWVGTDGRVGGRLELPGRYIVKSVWEDASRGLGDDAVVTVTTFEALRAEIVRRTSRLGGEAFAEHYVDGREFNVSLLEIDGRMEVLPVAEMCFVDFPTGKPRIVGERAKWDDASFEATHTVRRFDLPAADAALVEVLRAVARRVAREFGLGGFARIDLRVDSRGHPWILEINPNPCLAPGAGYLAAAERAAMSPEAVVAALVRAARPRAAAATSRS